MQNKEQSETMNKLYPTIATSFIALSAFALPTIQID